MDDGLLWTLATERQRSYDSQGETKRRLDEQEQAILSLYRLLMIQQEWITKMSEMIVAMKTERSVTGSAAVAG